MTLTSLFLLPALAAGIVLQKSWMMGNANTQYRSRKFRRRLRSRAIFLRWLVAALILATAVTLLLPVDDLSELAQGLLLTAAMMTPVFVYLLVAEMWAMLFGRKSADSHKTDFTDEDSIAREAAEKLRRKAAQTIGHAATQARKDVATNSQPEAQPDNQVIRLDAQSTTQASESVAPQAQPDPVAPGHLDTQAQPDASGPPGTQAGPLPAAQSPSQFQTASDAHLQTRSHTRDIPPAQSAIQSGKQSQPPQPLTASLHEQSPTAESVLDQTLSMDDQLESLDDLVGYHDIGADKYESGDSDHDRSAEQVVNPLEKAIAIARDAMLEDPGLKERSRDNLPALNRTELAEMVVNLRSDKMKLQKLVIAQKAVIESEKQAHARTRIVVKDAISVMRHARHAQRVAEKIARRERTERQRLEKDYIKVRRQLDNAMSTLDTHKKEVEH